jgi:phage tail-like protein
MNSGGRHGSQEDVSMNHQVRLVSASLFLALILGTLSLTAHGQGPAPRGGEAPRTLLARAAPGFLVQRDGDLVGFFTEVTGLGSETEVIEYREGSEETGTVRKLPGRTTYSNVTLKRGITSNMDLWDWREEVVGGVHMPSVVTVTLVGPRGRPVAAWHLQNAWPNKISGPQLRSDGNQVAIEELTLAHEGLKRAM